MLKIGDTISWKGNFGTADAVDAKVTSISICPLGAKYGDDVNEVEWSVVHGGNKTIVVDLDNGHWARGSALNKK